jgi:hypothetical protein
LSSSITITLLPEYMLGRYFQLAALSLYLSNNPGKLRSIYGALDKGVALTDKELVELVEAARDLLLRKYGLEEYKPCELLNAMRRDSPRAYYPNDGRAFSDLLYTSFNIESCPSEKEKKARISYPEIAVSFIEEVSSKNGAIATDTVDRRPALFGSFIFSEDKLRGLGGRAKHDKASLAVGVLGVMVSYAGRLRVGPQDFMELFIVPDGSLDSLRYPHLMYGVLFDEGIDSWRRLASSIVDLPNTSIERALVMASSIKLSTAGDLDLKQITDSWLPEKYILLRVKPEQRPNISGSNTLTSKFIASRSDISIVKALGGLVKTVRASKTAVQEKLSPVVGECVNYITEAYFTGNKTLLAECARLITPLYQDEDLPDEVRSEIARFLEVLSHGLD